MPISDDDLNYLRNLNTRPGPNAGRSIDPTKPGPDADRASPEPQDVREAAENLLIAIGMGWDLDGCAENLRAALAQSDAGPHRDPDDTKVICPNCTHQFRAISVMDQARLAQSDAGPVRTAPETCPHCFNEEDCGQIELCSALAKGPQSDAGPFPKPRCNHGGEPCGECHLQPGEACDICGATDKRSPDASGLIEAAEWPFGYQDTFNLISDATGLVGGHIGISVSKFEKAYNKLLRARAADRSRK